jgi:ATP-dependent RNA helicase RhlE
LTSFHELGLCTALLDVLDAEGYTSPTPIQAQAIPSVLAGKDLLGIAQTGTGKTAAFSLPILQLLSQNKQTAMRRGCRVLVLSPTRELASQIGDSIKTYGRKLGLTQAVIFGGMPAGPQRRAMARGVDVLIATPGRLIDHIEEGDIDLSGTEFLVLDEADQMLDLGFVKPIRRIVSYMPRQRQNLFFSATMPADIGKLAGELLTDPVKVAITPESTTVERIAQRVIHVERTRKRALLLDLLNKGEMLRTLVFTRTKRGADRVAKQLEAAGIRASAIHGNKSQSQRERALNAFRNGQVRVLVATDIAARGIDIDQVTHVINFDLPEVPEAYVHRIGRTARAGTSGVAISFCDGEERGLLRDIERVTRQKIPSEDRRGEEALAVRLPEIRESEPERDRNGGGRQGRPWGGRRDNSGSDRPAHFRRTPRAGEGQRNGESNRHGDGVEVRAANEARGEARHQRQDRTRPGGPEQRRSQGNGQRRGNVDAEARSPRERTGGGQNAHRRREGQGTSGPARSAGSNGPRKSGGEGRSWSSRNSGGGNKSLERVR